MITVVKINRKRIVLALLLIAGIVFCVLGFGGTAQKLIGWGEGNEIMVETIIMPIENALGEEETAISEDFIIDDLDADQAGESDYFVELRIDLEQARGKEMETLREVLATESDESVRKNAQERLMQLSSRLSQEMELENLIRAKGYRDAAVFLDTDTVTLILQPGQNMSDETDHTEIAELVSKTISVPEDSVVIITKER